MSRILEINPWLWENVSCVTYGQVIFRGYILIWEKNSLTLGIFLINLNLKISFFIVLDVQNGLFKVKVLAPDLEKKVEILKIFLFLGKFLWKIFQNFLGKFTLKFALNPQNEEVRKRCVKIDILRFLKNAPLILVN